MTGENSKLRRVIGLPHATAMVVGTIIGASIFVQPSEMTGHVPSVGGVFLVWLVSGILTIFGALVCAELASIFTRTGGVYIYLKESYHPSVGFLWGWAMFWSMHSGIIAALAFIFGRYTCYFLDTENTYVIKSIAISVIIVLSGINYLGVKQGSTLQTLFTAGKIIAILFIIVLGFSLGAKVPEHFDAIGLEDKTVTLKGFFLAWAAGLFAYGGWHMVTYNSEETINPRKTIPRALILGTLIVTACYIAMNAVYMYVLPLDQVASSKRIAADAADAVLGRGGGAFMAALVMFSTAGALTGIILCGPRVYYAMAQDGLLFQWMADIHPRFKTPHRAIILQAIWSSVLVFLFSYGDLFMGVVYTEWIFFGLMALGLILLRRRTGLKRDYKIWGYPVVPVLFIISSFSIVIAQLINEPRKTILGLSIVIIGLPVYFLWLHFSHPKQQNLEEPNE
ncbi:APC family permease [Planctomycetota bacterium]